MTLPSRALGLFGIIIERKNKDDYKDASHSAYTIPTQDSFKVFLASSRSIAIQ